MPRERLGPWGKLYASAEGDLAHYTDAQFRAGISILCRMIRDGELPKLRPLKAIYGGESVDFLVEEGFLTIDAQQVTITRWPIYQAPRDPTNAKRQRDWRERHSVDNSVDNARNTVTVTTLPTSTSTSESLTEKETTEPIARAREADDFDVLDRYYELTGSRPWGRRAGAWLTELQETHGRVQAVAALEVEARADSNTGTILSRVAVRLEAQAHRVAEAKKREPRKPTGLQAEIRDALEARYGEERAPLVTDPDPSDARAARDAVARLRASNGHTRGGAFTPVGDLLGSQPSGQDVPVPGSTLTDVGTAGSTQPTRGPGRSSPSSPDPAVRPSSSGPLQSPDGRESPKEQT